MSALNDFIPVSMSGKAGGLKIALHYLAGKANNGHSSLLESFHFFQCTEAAINVLLKKKKSISNQSQECDQSNKTLRKGQNLEHSNMSNLHKCLIESKVSLQPWHFLW